MAFGGYRRDEACWVTQVVALWLVAGFVVDCADCIVMVRMDVVVIVLSGWQSR